MEDCNTVEIEKNGSFFVSKTAVDALIEASATAKQIGSYLVLARFTERTGVFSVAGKSAINRYLSISNGAATSAIERLQQITVQLPHDDAAPKTTSKQPLPINLIVDPKLMQMKVPKSKYITYALNDFGCEADDKVWFPNSLIDNTGKFNNPLSRLLSHGNSDKAARALLLMYKYHDMEQSGGV